MNLTQYSSELQVHGLEGGLNWLIHLASARGVLIDTDRILRREFGDTPHVGWKLHIDGCWKR